MYQILLQTNNFEFWDQIYQENVFPVEKGKSELYRILHIQISIGTKFQLKLTILNFGPNLHKKSISSPKQKK